ncbi:MAG: glycoside hydrolase family 3 C-terminal domain-containing protein [Bacteroidia bacterium]|nr:glycoside hydrolase family 3 C-terminal domain-containing protein [Bacteroidia bacterium]
MRKVVYSLALALLCLGCTDKKYGQEQLMGHEAEIDAVIARMTLEEKVQMLHSKTIMSSEGVPRLGIQDIKYADGPFGVREEIGDGFRPLGWQTDSATYFPTGSALAATWSPELAYSYGNGIGREARRRGKDVMLGPAINIQRLPVGGRSYEYLSEDPFLSARLAVGFVEGMQDAGTAACIKHFALNNQETNRGSVNVIADERTMREIYLKPFEAAVREGGAMCVMPAYNKVNGDYCSENEHLLNEILRGEWGFKGMTVSDWGGTHSTMGAALHGLDVQMTGDNYLGQPVMDSIATGALSESVVDAKVREILRLRFAVKPVPEDEANTVTASQPETRAIAKAVAEKSIVLLQNNGILPLSSDVKKIAVIGRNADAFTASGGMGAGVKTPYEITPLAGIRNRAPEGVEVTYAPAYKNYLGMFARWSGRELGPDVALDLDEQPDPAMLEEAVALAREADVVLYFCGTNKNIESEGSDRTDIKLPVSQDMIAVALAEANPNIVTVVISGGPCELESVTECSAALIQGWWNGLEGGTALAEVLFGDIAPSGKLPFSMPFKLQDSPAYALHNFPPEEEAEEDLFGARYRRDILGSRGPRMPRYKQISEYTEGMLVGYRWFDTKFIPVLYPFGYGLSYVDFEYSDIKVPSGQFGIDDDIKVTFTVRNCGKMDAEEVAQLYVGRPDAKVEWPAKELKAFKRVPLKAGESRKVTLTVPVSELCHWDVEKNGWSLEGGRLDIMVGSSSKDIRLKSFVTIN